MINDFLDQMSDFSYGVLLMTELVGVAVTWMLHRVHRLMRVTAAFLTWLLIVNVSYFFAYYVYAPDSSCLYRFCYMIEATVVPACLFLLLAITHPNRLTWSTVTANALPYAVAIIAFLILRWPIIYTVVAAMATIHAFGILLYTIHAIREYNLSLLHIYSSLDNIDLRWTRSLIVMFAAWIALWLLEYQSHYYYFDIAYDLIVAVVVAITTYSMVRHAYTLYNIECNTVADDAIEDDNTDATPDNVASKIAPPSPKGLIVGIRFAV